MQSASRLWKQLDDLAANDPVGYKNFMASQSSQLKELAKELEFIPDVGFVIETELLSGISIGQTCTGQSLPFFVNVCQSDKLRGPSDVSLGKRKVKKDKIIIDVVVQKERVYKAKPSIPARTALAKDILARILPLENKHGPASFGPISFPALLYKGGRKADPHVLAPLPDHGVGNSLQSGDILLTKPSATQTDLLNGSRSTKQTNSSSLITEISSTTFDEEEVNADAQTSNSLVAEVKKTTSPSTDRAVTEDCTIVNGNAIKNSLMTEVTTRKTREKAAERNDYSSGVVPRVPNKTLDNSSTSSKLTDEVPEKSSKIIKEVPAKPSKLNEEVPAKFSEVIEKITVNTSNLADKILIKSPQRISVDRACTATAVSVRANSSNVDVRSCSRCAKGVHCENQCEPQRILDGSADMFQNRPSWIEDITTSDSAVILRFSSHIPCAEVSLFTSEASALLSYKNDSFTVQFAPSNAKWDKRKHCLILKR